MFDIAEKIKNEILSEKLKPRDIGKYKKLNSNIAKFLVEEKLSKKKLERLRLEYDDIKFAETVDGMNDNRWGYNHKDKESIKEIVKQFELKDKNKKISSGLFWYPPTGYCGWHTNSNNPGKRNYLVWAEEDNKSFFRYQDKKTGEIVTKWEKKGWQIQEFMTPIWHCVGSYTNRISIGISNYVEPINRELKGFHICDISDEYGDWRINEKNNMKLDLKYLRYLLTEDKLKKISHKEICWKGMDDVNAEQQGKRYKECDIEFPCILLINAPNPKNMKYRMIDGKHRMAKMKKQNINKSSFFVLEYDDVINFVEERNV